jgi:hypothetical protein
MANDFLEKVRKAATREPGGKLVDLSLAALILAKSQPESLLGGLKTLAVLKGKPVVKATLRAIVEAALED